MDILFDDKQVRLEPGQTVLSALLDNGHDIPNNCRVGACQSCLMQAVDGAVPSPAQAGLKDTLKTQGYFLACQCRPVTPMEVVLPRPDAVRTPARIIQRTLLGRDVLRLRLVPEAPFEYRAGQYLTVWNPHNVGRSYSLASVPALDDHLELQIRLIPGGKLSAWLYEHANIGDILQLQTSAGACFYLPGTPDQKLLLAGTGTGLAPLSGIARDALQHGHRGEIHLIHGAVQASGLYQHEVLQAMAERYQNFHYHASVLEAAGTAPGINVGSIEQLSQTVVPDPSDWRVYLCGAVDMVNGLKKKLFLSGASISNIYSDPFVSAADSLKTA